MTSRDFCYWLQGFLEISGAESLAKLQVECIQKHLSLVFTHEIDPSFPKAQQNALNLIHKSDMKARC